MLLVRKGQLLFLYCYRKCGFYFCIVIPSAASIRGQLLSEGGFYLRKYGTSKSINIFHPSPYLNNRKFLFDHLSKTIELSRALKLLTLVISVEESQSLSFFWTLTKRVGRSKILRVWVRHFDINETCILIRLLRCILDLELSRNQKQGSEFFQGKWIL